MPNEKGQTAEFVPHVDRAVAAAHSWRYSFLSDALLHWRWRFRNGSLPDRIYSQDLVQRRHQIRRRRVWPVYRCRTPTPGGYSPALCWTCTGILKTKEHRVLAAVSFAHE